MLGFPNLTGDVHPPTIQLLWLTNASVGSALCFRGQSSVRLWRIALHCIAGPPSTLYIFPADLGSAITSWVIMNELVR